MWATSRDPQFGPAAASQSVISNVMVVNAAVAGVEADDSTATASTKVTVTGNTIVSGNPLGVCVNGAAAAAVLMNNAASITGNGIGVDVDAGKALIQGNDLTANSVAGIWATNGAVVDAGNCTAPNVTGLGTSSGGNDLAGYLTGAAKAIVNGNSGGLPVVLAEHDNFGASTPADNIPGAFNGAVTYSQTPVVMVAPGAVNVTCVSDVPSAATTFAEFLGIGGYFAANSQLAVTFADSTNFSNPPFTGSGVITRTYTLTDGCGVVGQPVQTITFQDTVPPTFTTAPTDVTYSADPGQCSKANVTWTVAASDTCALPSLVSIPPSGSTFEKGVTTVTNIATDTSGNSVTNIFHVTVLDTEKPVFVTHPTNSTVVADITAHASLPDVTLEVQASDNCDTPIITQVPLAGTVEGLGVTPVTVWLADTSGNSNSYTVNINVVDKAAPTWTYEAPDLTVTTLQDKDPYATGTPIATDAGGAVSITYDDVRTNLSGCDTTGWILRTWTATDPSNNSTNYVQSIAVIDTNTPYFTTATVDITVTNDPGQCSAVVNYSPAAMDLGYFQGFENPAWTSGDVDTQPSTDWNDYNSHITRVASGTDGIVSSSGTGHAVIDNTAALLSDVTGAFSRLGGYSSVFGNGFRVSQDVYIDVNDPGVTGASATSGYAWDLSAADNGQGGNYNSEFIFHAAAYDSSGVVIAAGNDGSADSILPHDDYRTSPNTKVTTSGWYTFQWLFRATNNVLAVDMSVSDSTGTTLLAQTLSNPADVISTVVGGHRYLWFTFINANKLAIDNTKFERIIPVTSTISSGTAFPVGNTPVTNQAMDACGNSTNITFNVTVLDKEGPVIPVIANITVTNTLGNCTVPVTYASLDVTDNCGVASTVFTPPTGNAFGVGITPVSVVAEDIHGNYATNGFSVTVIDTTATSLATSQTPQVYGQDILLTATVAACPAQPITGGTVTFYDGNLALGTGALGAVDVNGTATATLDIATLTAGSHNLTAAYLGDALHLASTSGVQTEQITQATLTVSGITANNKMYDGNSTAVLNVDSAVLAGVYFSDDVTLDATGAVGTFSDKNVGAGKTVAISGLTISGTAAFNYTLVQPSTAADITRKPLTITANSTSKTYGQTVTFAGTEYGTTGMVGSESIASVTLTSAGAAATAGVGDYDIVPSAAVGAAGTDLGNYGLTYVNGTLTVNPAGLTITANNQNKTYGQNLVFAGTEFTQAGLLNSDTISSVSLSSTGATNSATVGGSPYTVTIGNAVGSGLGNYTITYVNGSLIVSPALLAITANDTNRVYGTTNPVFTATYTGFVNGEDATLVTGTPTLTCAVVTNAPIGAYSNSIVVQDAGALYATNYTFAPLTSTNGTLTVVTAQLVPSITAADKVYDGTASVTLTSSNVTGVVGNDNVYLVIGGASFSDANVANGKTVTATGLTLAGTEATNYALAATTATTTANITAASLTITANNDSKTYDGNAYSGGNGVYYAGFVIGETNTVLGGGLSYSGTSQAAVNAGVYTIIPQGLTSGNYNISFVGGTLTINQLAVMVTADAQSKAYGSIDPALTYAVNPALVAGDSFSGSLTRAPGETVGSYAIGQGTLNLSANYSLSYTGNNLAITPDSPVLTIYSASPIKYSLPLSAATITAVATNGNNGASVAGTFSFTSPGTVPTATGSQSVTFTPADLLNYSSVSGAVIVPVIDPAILGQPTNMTVVLGGDAAFSVTATGSGTLSYQWQQNGVNLPGQTSSTLTLNTVADSAAGTYSVTITNANGTAVSSNATLTITHPPVFLTQPASLTVNQGGTASFSVSMSGRSPFSYQWLSNGVPITSWQPVTGNHFTLNNVIGAYDGNYSVEVTNLDGMAFSSNALLTVIVPPTITSMPVSLTNNAGTTATFSVTNTGSPSDYRWYFNQTNLLADGTYVTGSTTPTLTVSNVLGANGGVYSVSVSNAAGIALSSNAVLTVIDPIITSQPVSMTTNLGSPASFTMASYGTAPNYQWLHNGNPVGGATGATYALGSVADSDAGDYVAVVSNAFGSVTSSIVTLTIIDPPIITSQPQSLTVNATSNADFTVSFTGTLPALQWYFNGTLMAGQNSATLHLFNVMDANQGNYSVVLSNAANVVTSTPAALSVIDAPVITGEPQSLTVNATSNASFTVSYTGTSPNFQWFKNGNQLSNGGNVSGATAATLTLSNVQDGDATGYTVVLSNAAGSVTSTPPAILTVIDPPVITGEPQNLTVNATSNASFTVSYTGTSPNIQWFKNGNLLGNGGNASGATSATLTLSNVHDSDATGYTVVLNDAAGSVTSAPPAILTVIDPPVFTQQPLSITNNAGTVAVFTVITTGTTPTYRWVKDGTNILANGGNVYGADTATLTLSNVFGIDGGNYSVVVSNAALVATSSNALLTVIDPVIATQPVGATNIDGATVAFAVAAVGTEPLSYQWYQDGFVLDGETGSTLTLNDLADSDAGDYTVVITNIYGSVTSTPAVLVTVPPLIVTQPADVIALVGDAVNFSVSVNGATPFSYRWQQNGTNVAGGNNRILSFASVTVSNAGNYRVYVTNPNGTQLSDLATLSVYTSTVPTLTLTYNDPVVSVTVAGVPTFTYGVQNSSNLLNWAPLLTSQSPFSFTVTNNPATNGSQFYRGFYLHR